MAHTRISVTWESRASARNAASRRANESTSQEASCLVSPDTDNTQTTAPADEAATAADFDFARAAALLTDAAAQAPAPRSWRISQAAAEVELKDDKSPVTAGRPRLRGDHPRGLGTACARAFRWCPRRLRDDRRASAALLPRRSAGRHQGVHQEAQRLHRQHRPDRGRTPGFGLVYAPARALLAVTLAEGKAVRGRAPPERSRRRSRSARLTHAARAHARTEGLTALVSLSHLDPETEASWRSSTLRSDRASGRRSNSLPSPEAKPTSIRGSAPPWNGTPRPAMPCSRRRAAWSSTPTATAPLRQDRAGLRNPSFIAWGCRPPDAGRPQFSNSLGKS